jgi:hypothetical protein
MSEWKWCENCGHHYGAHRPDGQDEFGACTMEECDCQMMAFNVANF